MKRATLAAILICTPVGLCAGFFLGRGLGLEAARNEERRLASLAGTAPTPAPVAQPAPGRDGSAALVPPPPGFESLNLDEILASAGPMERFQAIMAWVQRLPQDRIEGALTKLRDDMQGRFDPDGLLASHMLMTRFANDDPKLALSYLKSLDIFGQGLGTSTVLATLATKDPQAAAEFFKDENNAVLNLPQAGGLIAGSVAREWAKRDPRAALEWAQSLREGLRGGALSSLFGSMAVEDPAKAAQAATNLTLDAGEDRNRVFGQVAQTWAARDPQAALAWVNSLPAGDARDEATRRALDGWANSEPAAAAAHLGSLSDPADQQKLMSTVTGPWARRDPAAAADWLATQPEGKGREESVRNVMWMWSNTDPTAASTWLNSQPAGPSKDQGIVTLANQTAATDPEAALTWSATVQDPLKRQIQLQKGIENWMKRDETAARAWVESSPSLSDAERAKWSESGR